MQINSQVEYDNAVLLIQDLSGAPEDTPEERMLIRLALAVCTDSHRLEDEEIIPLVSRGTPERGAG